MARQAFAALQQRVEDLCTTADNHLLGGRFSAAIVGYVSAFELLPSPKQSWTWTSDILSNLVEAYLQKRDFRGATTAMSVLLECPASARNGRIHMQHARLLFETGHLTAARSEFLRAFCQSGRSVFQGHDSKYWDWLWQD